MTRKELIERKLAEFDWSADLVQVHVWLKASLEEMYLAGIEAVEGVVPESRDEHQMENSFYATSLVLLVFLSGALVVGQLVNEFVIWRVANVVKEHEAILENHYDALEILNSGHPYRH